MGWMKDVGVSVECGVLRCPDVRLRRALQSGRARDCRVQNAAAVGGNSAVFPENIPEQGPVLVLMLDS